MATEPRHNKLIITKKRGRDGEREGEEQRGRERWRGGEGNGRPISWASKI